MIGNSKNEKARSKKIKIKMPNIKDISKLKKNKPLLKIIIWIICILVSFIILLKIILAIARKVRKKKIQSVANNDEIQVVFTASGTVSANAVLLHNVDVTAGTKNGTALLFGFVNYNRLESDVQALVTPGTKIGDVQIVKGEER